MTQAPHQIDEMLHDLDRLEQLAVRLLDTHIPGIGRACLECGAHWPCEQTILAEHNLEMVRPHGRC